MLFGARPQVQGDGKSSKGRLPSTYLAPAAAPKNLTLIQHAIGFLYLSSRF